VATRVDSRTILDVMGRNTAGQGRHAVSAAGIVAPHARSRRVRHRNRDQPRGGFLEGASHAGVRPVLPDRPPSDDDAEGAAGAEAPGDDQDPLYEEAVRLVLQMGKASTSTLQRHCGWATAAPRASST